MPLSAAGAGTPALPSVSGADGTKTTLRKSISDSFCIIFTKSWSDIKLIAGSTPCISGAACAMNCCQVPTIFCRLKYIGRRVIGSALSPSSCCFCILICAMVKTGISLKVALNLGDSVMAFSIAFCAISGVIASPVFSFSLSSGVIVNNIRAPRRSLVSGTRRYSTPFVDCPSSSEPGFFNRTSWSGSAFNNLNQIFPKENADTFKSISSLTLFSWVSVAFAASGLRKK
mmetsp:Transcript_112062/g.167757  ORF Transcript_112062/g.167757 Transcript_112062/m.167757 type:complete len:229 (-) Transcript_112062:415-1101(-)